MAAISGVLLVPWPGDPHGFLALWGVKVRCAHRVDGLWRLSVPPAVPEALVLAWDGVEDAAGIERAFAICCPDGAEKTIGLILGRQPLYEAMHRAAYAEWRGLAPRWVAVDAAGREIAGSLRLTRDGSSG